MAANEPLVLYGKGGCGPCIEAHRVLTPIVAQFGLELRWIDVDLEDSPPGYRDEVPVVTYAGKVLARGRVVAKSVEAMLSDED